MNNAQTSWLVALVFGVGLAASAPEAISQNVAKPGDLVEFTSGLGPTLAEIVEGPDASGYVVILIPTGKRIPVNTQKLRLIQAAGTPNASIAVGEPVGWVDGGYKQKGSVVKVNGTWCQVKTPDATTIGWVECKVLRTAAQAAAPTKPAPDAKASAPKSAVPKLQGNWENADGTVKWEPQAGGKCFMSLGPMSGACTYKPTANGVVIMIDGDELALEANDDGSLSSVSEGNSMMAMRLKRKK